MTFECVLNPLVSDSVLSSIPPESAKSSGPLGSFDACLSALMTVAGTNADACEVLPLVQAGIQYKDDQAART
jgi:hypothetical protein